MESPEEPEEPPVDPEEPEQPDDIDYYTLKIQVGSNSKEFYIIELTDSTVEGLKLNEVNLNTMEAAEESIDKIEYALNSISSKRGEIGTHENALRYLYNNVGNYEYNLIFSYSRILDADMVKEIMSFTKHGMLEKVNLALSKQAKVNSELVLKLLDDMSI